MRTKVLPLAKSILQQSERAVIFLSNPPYRSNPPGGLPRQINKNSKMSQLKIINF